MAGSSVLSSSSTTRKNGLRSSCLCSTTLTRTVAVMARAIAAARMTPRASRPLRRFVSFTICIALEILVPFSVKVPDRAVAADARDRLGPASGVDLIDHGLVALPTGSLRHRAVPTLDLNRLVELPRRERQRVVITVRSFRRVLREE